MSISGIRKKIDLVDKNILLLFFRLKDYRFNPEILANKKGDANVFLAKLLKKTCTGKKDLHSSKDYISLYRLLNKRLSLVRQMRNAKDLELNKISLKKRYFDRKREDEIIYRVAMSCEKKNIEPKKLVILFKSILKFSKKAYA